MKSRENIDEMTSAIQAIYMVATNIYLKHKDDNLVQGDEDILDNLMSSPCVLAKVFDRMGITIDDPRFLPLTKHHLGKSPSTILKHYGLEERDPKEETR